MLEVKNTIVNQKMHNYDWDLDELNQLNFDGVIDDADLYYVYVNDKGVEYRIDVEGRRRVGLPMLELVNYLVARELQFALRKNDDGDDYHLEFHIFNEYYEVRTTEEVTKLKEYIEKYWPC